MKAKIWHHLNSPTFRIPLMHCKSGSMIRKHIIVLSTFWICNVVAGVEQTLIIDLDRNPREIDDNYFYSNNRRQNNGYGDRRTDSNGFGDRRNGYLDSGTKNERYGGFGQNGLRSTSQRTRYTQPPYSYSPSTIPQDSLPNSIFEMDRTFSERLNSLTGRVDRLEANQNSFRRSVMAEWQLLSSTDKRIRLFNSAKNTWREAQEICEANTGSLLHIESADENEQISGLLHAAHPVSDGDGDAEEPVYWIGMQSTLAFSIPTQNFTNFDIAQANDDFRYQSVDSPTNSSRTRSEEGVDTSVEDTSAEQLEDEDETRSTGHPLSVKDKFLRGCAVISPTRNGKWISRDCEERHQFICQL